MTKTNAVTAGLLVALIFGGGTAFADSFGSPNFAIYGIQSLSINDSLDENTVCVVGNAGTGGIFAGSFSLNKCLVNGNVYVTTDSVLNLGSHGAYTGSEVLGSLTSVNNALVTESGNLAGLSPTQTINGNVTSGMTFIPGVYDINGNINLNQQTFTLNGSGQFVFNVTGTVDFSCSNIVLTGGASTANVIFNITGTGTSTWNKDCTTWAGTILAPNETLDIHNQWGLGAFSGQVFGNNVYLHSAGSIVEPVPEPASLILLATGLLGIGVMRRKRGERLSR